MSDQTNELQDVPVAGGDETAAPDTVPAADGSATPEPQAQAAPENAAPENAASEGAASENAGSEDPVSENAATADAGSENAGGTPAAAETASAETAAAPPLFTRNFDAAISGGNVSSDDSDQTIDASNVDYSRTFHALTEGEVIKGRVVHIDREGILVDVGTKSEGLVTPQEMSRGIPGAPEETINVGDTIDVYVMEPEDQEGNPVLSKKRADFEKAWERVLEAKNEQETLQAMVTDRVKGGLVVDLGIRGFIPASHVGSGRVRNLEQYIGQVLPLKVIEVDKERRKVVLSHRLATEEEREKQREDTIASLAEGQVRPGAVRRITDYGAFVDLGGIDGLLHISEMSWTRIKHPSEVVKVGDDIQVMVLKINLEQNRVSLGLRQILPDPWTEVAARYNVGDVVTGSVSRLVPFGAFVALEGGIEGIIPNTELSSKRVNKPEQVVKVGDEVEVKVTDIDKDGRRIVLSRRQVESQKEQDNFQQFTRERQERQERQQQPARETQRFTIGDALADQLAALNRGEDVAVPQPEAREDQDLTETVENLAASTVEAPKESGTLDPVPPVNDPEGSEASGPVPSEDLSDFTPPEKVPVSEAPSANELESPHDGESASTIVSEAAADAALEDAEYPVGQQNVSPEGMGHGLTDDQSRGEMVAEDEPTGEASADEPTTIGAAGSAQLEDEQPHTEASEQDARNA